MTIPQSGFKFLSVHRGGSSSRTTIPPVRKFAIPQLPEEAPPRQRQGQRTDHGVAAPVKS